MTVTKVSETRNIAQRVADLGPVLAIDFILARASRLALRSGIAALAARTCKGPFCWRWPLARGLHDLFGGAR